MSRPPHPARQRCALLSLSIALTLCACVSDPVMVQKGQIPELDDDQGILVFDLEAKYPVHQMNLDRTVGAVGVKPGRHLALLIMDAGSYRWTRFFAEGYTYRFPRDRQKWAFRIVPGRVNYAFHIHAGENLYNTYDGHFKVRRHALWHENRAAIAIESLEKTHGAVLERYPPIYVGPDRDDFLEAYVEAREARARREVGE